MRRFAKAVVRILPSAVLMLILGAPRVQADRPYTPDHPDPLMEPWRWRSFPELEGLGLRCMAQAKDGAMWFGVDGGVRRYDGVDWMAYTPDDGLLGAPVNVLCAARDGSVYTGTDQGISRFKDGTWTRVFPPEGDLPWPVDDLMETSDGGLWAGTAWGGATDGRGRRPTVYHRGCGRRLDPACALCTALCRAA